MNKYSNEQLHEAYTIEYYAHKQTQVTLNNEIREHAYTRRLLMDKIDELKEAELNYIVNAAQRFYSEIGIPPLTTEEALSYYKEILKIPGVFVCVTIGKGFIVGHVTPSFLQPSVTLCTEAAWFVEKEYRGTTVGIKLLKDYENEAIRRGATQITMVNIRHLNMDGLDKIYTKLGYNLFEQHYLKEI